VGFASCNEDMLDSLTSLQHLNGDLLFGEHVPSKAKGKILCWDCNRLFHTISELNQHRRKQHTAFRFYVSGEGKVSSKELFFFLNNDSIKIHCLVDDRTKIELLRVSIQGFEGSQGGVVERVDVENNGHVPLHRDARGGLYDTYKITIYSPDERSQAEIMVYQPDHMIDSLVESSRGELSKFLSLSPDCDCDDLQREVERFQDEGKAKSKIVKCLVNGILEFAIGLRLFHEGEDEWRHRFQDCHWMLRPFRQGALGQIRIVTGFCLLELSPLLRGDIWQPFHGLGALVGRTGGTQCNKTMAFPNRLIPSGMKYFLEQLQDTTRRTPNLEKDDVLSIHPEWHHLLSLSKSNPDSPDAMILRRKLQNSPSLSVRLATEQWSQVNP
jgi:hypothetical protein